ncbi:D-alanyl-D-alanine carboxypeptidase [Streptomyces sp. NBC_01262]|nr:D-alanyl-D-alanine carboxypeptidase [Streptomyces sp. NBC_01262]
MPSRAARRPALVLSALALACGTALTTAPAAYAKASPSPSATPTPPARMSTVGGALLGRSGTQASLQTGAPALPKKLTARSWIISDAESGEVLAAHNAHWRLAPASTLKMLFADTVLPKFASTQTHKVVTSDFDGIGAGSSLVGIKEGLTYTVKDLWLGVFLRSGNDAVHVLSAMNGGVDETVQEMQRKAEELQAGDTHIVSPDGYDMPGQTSSAYDLSLFARAGLQNADFREYCSTVRYDFPGEWKTTKKKGKTTKTRSTFEIQNTDRLLAGDYDIDAYQGLAGVKNGYTSKAGNTFTGVAQRGDRTLLVTVMHPDSGHDLVYKEAAALLDWGFKASASGKVTPVGSLVPSKSAQAAASASAGTSAAATATPSAAAAAASATADSSSGGMWTALGIAGGSMVVVGGITFLVRRRWPLPQGHQDPQEPRG